MKKLVLLFAAVVLTGTAAFAVSTTGWCTGRAQAGLSASMPVCEELFLNIYPDYPGDPKTKKCCWRHPSCKIALEMALPGNNITCESLLQNGQTIGPNNPCCWESDDPSIVFTKGDNGKGGKKTPVQAPKNKKGKTTKVQTNTKKVTAKK